MALQSGDQLCGSIWRAAASSAIKEGLPEGSETYEHDLPEAHKLGQLKCQRKLPTSRASLNAKENSLQAGLANAQ